MMDSRTAIGGNNPPDPIDEICAQFEAVRMESESWLDGQEVTNEDQMKAVDALRKGAREWRQALEAGQKSATAPLYDAYKAEGARWKPTVEDAQRIEKGLVALVDGFKRKLAEVKEEERRKAEAEAWEKTRAAREAAERASAANIEEQRAAAAAIREAEEAQRRAAQASKSTVKGLRTFDVTEVLDATAYARWLWQHDREALLAWMNDHARRNKHHVPGIVETRQERRAV